MVRVYLDWNIFSYLKQFKESKEPYTSLNKNLLQNGNRVLIPYSSAHLTDLANGDNNSDKAQQEISADLEYLKQLTNEHCILYDYKNKNTYPDKYNIQDYYEQIKESKKYATRSVEDIFSFSGDEMFKDLNTSLIDLFKLLPTGIDFSKLNELPNEWPEFKTMFEETRKQDSFYNLLSDSRNFLHQYDSDPKLYAGLRNKSLKILRINHTQL